jgi:hypothetical protein
MPERRIGPMTGESWQEDGRTAAAERAGPSAGGGSDASPDDRERGADSRSVATAGAGKRVRAERQGRALQAKAASGTPVSKRRSW